MATRCCADCGEGCEMSDLVLGQSIGDDEGWDAAPFGPAGANSDAIAFWGAVGCCDRCQECPTCQDA